MTGVRLYGDSAIAAYGSKCSRMILSTVRRSAAEVNAQTCGVNGNVSRAYFVVVRLLFPASVLIRGSADARVRRYGTFVRRYITGAVVGWRI